MRESASLEEYFMRTIAKVSVKPDAFEEFLILLDFEFIFTYTNTHITNGTGTIDGGERSVASEKIAKTSVYFGTKRLLSCQSRA